MKGMILMDKMIEKIKRQNGFKWQEIKPYNGYRNSFVAHVYKHPIREKYTKKWDSLINYDNIKTISDSYYKASVDLLKFDLKHEYNLHYEPKHCSYNILNINTGLMICLKFWKKTNLFYIATCYFPNKEIIELFSKKNFQKEKYFDNKFNIGYTMYIDNNVHDVKDVESFEKAMGEFFGVNSIEYKILFNNETNNIDETINCIIKETTNYLDFMIRLIKSEDDKEFYFVYNDGIEYVVKLSLLYKIKDENYKQLYQKFLKIDINNSYKEALDECKKYIDEGEIYGKF